MSKKEHYKQDLIPLFEELLETNNSDKISEYLTANSNLPSPRGNLELGYAFAEVTEAFSEKNLAVIVTLILKLIAISSDEAPVNSAREFLPFCGSLGLGAVGSVHSKFFQEAISRLRRLANDSRWRTREGVAMGLQRLLEKHSQRTVQELQTWISRSNWLEMRAIAAAVAEPPFLKDRKNAEWALELHKTIFSKVSIAMGHRSEEFNALKKGLSYSLSVIVEALPTEGFEYLHQLIDLQDENISQIVKVNLKKNRLIKNYPNEVENLLKFLEK